MIKKQQITHGHEIIIISFVFNRSRSTASSQHTRQTTMCTPSWDAWWTCRWSHRRTWLSSSGDFSGEHRPRSWSESSPTSRRPGCAAQCGPRPSGADISRLSAPTMIARVCMIHCLIDQDIGLQEIYWFCKCVTLRESSISNQYDNDK